MSCEKTIKWTKPSSGKKPSSGTKKQSILTQKNTNEHRAVGFPGEFEVIFEIGPV